MPSTRLSLALVALPESRRLSTILSKWLQHIPYTGSIYTCKLPLFSLTCARLAGFRPASSIRACAFKTTRGRRNPLSWISVKRHSVSNFAHYSPADTEYFISLSTSNNRFRSEEKSFSVCGEQRIGIPPQHDASSVVCSRALRSLLLACRRVVGSDLVIAALASNREYIIASRGRSVDGSKFFDAPPSLGSFLVLDSSRVASRSANPQTNGRACPRAWSVQRMHRGDTQKKPMISGYSSGQEARRRASRGICCTLQALLPSDEASVRARQSHARRSWYGSHVGTPDHDQVSSLRRAYSGCIQKDGNDK